MKSVDHVLDLITEVLSTMIGFLFRLVALASLPALVAWLVLMGVNLLLGGAIFQEWTWLLPVLTIIQIVGLDSNLICLLADAALDRLPNVSSERALRVWKARRVVRSVVIGLTGAAIILPLVLIGFNPFLPENGPVSSVLTVLRTVAVVAVVILNVVLSSMVRRRVHAAELESFQVVAVSREGK